MANPGKIVPQNPEAEEAVLGSLVIDPDAYHEVSGFLRGAHFYVEKNAWVYTAISDLRKEGSPVDFLTLCDRLESKGQLGGVGGAAYITRLINAVPSAIHVVQYAKIVEDKARRRRTIEMASALAQAAYQEDNDIDWEANKVAVSLFDAVHTPSESIGESIADIKAQVSEWAADPLGPGEVRGISTGWSGVDRMLGGMEPSLIVCGARTSVGKSAFAVQLALNVAAQGISVLYVTAEMAPKQLINRMASTIARVTWSKVKEGRLSEGETASLSIALDLLGELPLRIEWGTSIAGVLAKAQSHKARHELGLLIGDSLGLFVSRTEENRQLKLGSGTRGFLNLATRLEIPVLTTHHLKRPPEGRKPGSRPQLSDYQWSSMIEQDTDLAWFLTREELNTSFADGRPNPKGRKMKLWCLKDRLNGRLGVASLYFGEFAEIRDQANGYEQDEEGQKELPF